MATLSSFRRVVCTPLTTSRHRLQARRCGTTVEPTTVATEDTVQRPEHPLRRYLEAGRHQVWEEVSGEGKELPSKEAMAHTFLKVRLFNRLLAAEGCSDDEKATLEGAVARLSARIPKNVVKKENKKKNNVANKESRSTHKAPFPGTMPHPSYYKQCYSSFLLHVERTGAELNDDEGEGVTNFHVLGVEFDLTSSPIRYRAAPDWVAKCVECSVLSAVLKNDCTAGDFDKVLGGFEWFLHCTNRNLCYFRDSLSLLPRLAISREGIKKSPIKKKKKKSQANFQYRKLFDCQHKKKKNKGIEKKIYPGDQVFIPPSVISELTDIASAMRCNDWILDQPERPTVVVWSDASARGWAVLIESEFFEPVVQGVFPRRVKHFINQKELYAAWLAVRLAAVNHPNHEVSLRIDNSHAVLAINNGHSKHHLDNEVLCAIFDTAKAANMSVSATWVSTKSQRADKFTRGEVSSTLVSLPPVLKEYESVDAIFCQ